METVTNNKRILEKYLKDLAPDKSKILVDKGTDPQLDIKPSVREGDDNSFIIISRVKEKAEDQTADLSAISGNLNSVYPGAIVHADSALVDGRPNGISGEDLPRKPITVGLDINGNTNEPVVVNKPNRHRVMAAINAMVQKWFEDGHKAAAKMSYRSAFVYDSKQIEAKLGIQRADKLFGVDFEACSNGVQKEMLICFNQIYYTARVEALTASSLFADEVTPDDLKENGIDEKNPAAALVTSVDFGRQIVVRFTTNNVTDKVEAAWNASFSGTGIENKNEYKHIMENTTFNVFVYGGTTETAAQILKDSHDIAEVNRIIAKDMSFDKDSAVCPISYTTNFIDDGTQAIVSRSAEYVKTTVEKRGNIIVKTDSANAYATKHQKFHGRPVIGVNEDGSFKLGPWEKLMDEEGGNKSLTVKGKYAEFGFSFDIVWGTDWPYSDVFWTADMGAAKDIYIEWGGTVRNAWITIKVNGKEVVNNTNCSSHDEYNFGC